MKFPVELGQVTAFARAVGLEPPQAGDLVPPTFTACSTQLDPTHMRGMVPSGALGIAATLGDTVLHAEQEFTYLAPVRVGDVLTVEERVGESWTKPGRTGTPLTFTEVVKEFRDPEGAVVVRSRMVLVAK